MCMLHVEHDNTENIATKRLSCTDLLQIINCITGQENAIFDNHFSHACSQAYVVGKAMARQ